MAAVGVFWIYKNQLFGKPSPLDNGVEGVPNLIDSPDNHADIWDTEQPGQKCFPELIHREYQDIPRGRVLFDKRRKKSIVYMDRTLMTATNRRRIAELFELTLEDVIWRKDSHYTTDSAAIDRLFSDEQ